MITSHSILEYCDDTDEVLRINKQSQLGLIDKLILSNRSLVHVWYTSLRRTVLRILLVITTKVENILRTLIMIYYFCSSVLKVLKLVVRKLYRNIFLWVRFHYINNILKFTCLIVRNKLL